MTTSIRIVVLAAAAALAGPGVAHAQQPTVEFDRGCYTEDQEMHFTGAGYTPGGQVDLTFASDFILRGGLTTYADAAGALNGFAVADTADQLMSDDQSRATILATANDRTRIDANQQPPESQFGFTQFTFTRWEGYSPGRYVPGGRATVEIYGWAFATGKRAWLLFRKGSRSVASVKLGRLDQECGDRTARIRVPRGLDPGRYRVVLTTDRKLRDRYTWRKARVTARRSGASAAAAGTRAMSRVSGRLGLD